MKKRCNKCKEIKPVSEFGKEKRAKNGYKPRCKECSNEYYNSVYYKYRDIKLNHAKEYYLENSESIKKKSNEAYKNQDPEERKKIKSKWRNKNRVRLRIKQNNYFQNRIKNDPLFKTARNMRSMVSRLVKDKTERTAIILGYTSNDLINKLGQNIKGNHIDHKVPMSWFLPETSIKIISNLENLHLINGSENVKKHNCFAHPISYEYYLLIKPYIKSKYQHLLKTL